jgi:hypothetical protein
MDAALSMQGGDGVIVNRRNKGVRPVSPGPSVT